MFEIQTILVPTDFSDPSDLALRYGYEMSKKFDARLILIHITDDPVLFAATTSDEYRAQEIAKSNQRLEQNVRQVLGTVEGVTLLSKCGSTASEIVDYAKAEGISLVVMGSHGHSAMASMLLGNTAEHVVRHSPCPVMTVRSPEHNF